MVYLAISVILVQRVHSNVEATVLHFNLIASCFSKSFFNIHGILTLFIALLLCFSIRKTNSLWLHRLSHLLLCLLRILNLEGYELFSLASSITQLDVSWIDVTEKNTPLGRDRI